MAMHKLQRTRNYSQFAFSKDNRDVDMLNMKYQHNNLRKSMQQYGFLPSFPLMVSAVNGKFIIKDGQHRFTFARELGLDVYFVVDETDIDVSEINQAQASWSVLDFAQRWSSSGRKDYWEAMAFSEKQGIPLSVAAAMLAGTTSFGNIALKFRDGSFRVTNRGFADNVANCYNALCSIKRGIRNSRLLAALYSCCLVDYFDAALFVKKAAKRTDLVVSCGTREAFLAMIDDIYNYGRNSRVPLAFDADAAVRARTPIKRKAA